MPLTSASANHNEVIRSVKLIRLVSCRSANDLNPALVKVERQISCYRCHLDAPDYFAFDLAANLLLRVVRRRKSELMPVVQCGNKVVGFANVSKQRLLGERIPAVRGAAHDALRA